MPDRSIDIQTALQQKNLLYDFYGELLTAKQRACFEMHYLEDLSLAEIGAQYHITPQAAADILKRANRLLDGYEEALGLMKKYASQKEWADLIYHALDEMTYAVKAITGENERRIENIKNIEKIKEDIKQWVSLMI